MLSEFFGKHFFDSPDGEEEKLELTFSRKKITQAGFVLILALGLIGLSLWANSRGYLDQFLVGRNEIATPGTENVQATLQAIYTPKLGEGQAAWYSQVCGGMSAQGCELFKSLYGPPIWGALESGAILPVETQVNFLEEVEAIDSGHRIWKFGFVVSDLSEARDTQDVPEAAEISGEVYAEVSYDLSSDSWLLERILFDQEIAARYGS